MSSILEHMCADVLQQTATQIKFPSTGVDTMPYWNLLPPKRPIKEVLTDIFGKVLEKGWVDSRSIHIFDTLLHMGGVYWFCNNLIKVPGVQRVWARHPPRPRLGEQVSLRLRETSEKIPGSTKVSPVPAFPCTQPGQPGFSGRPLKCCEKIPWNTEAGPGLGAPGL